MNPLVTRTKLVETIYLKSKHGYNFLQGIIKSIRYSICIGSLIDPPIIFQKEALHIDRNLAIGSLLRIHMNIRFEITSL